MISNEEVSYKASAQADGTAQEQIVDYSNSFIEVDSESSYCTQIHDKLVILSTQSVEDSDDVEVTFTVGEYPNAKKYTESIDYMLKDIRENKQDYDVGVGQFFVEAKSLHSKRLKHNYQYPFGNDVNDSTFTFTTAELADCIAVTRNPTTNVITNIKVNTVKTAEYITSHLFMKSVKGTEQILIYDNGAYVDSEDMKHVRMALVDMLGDGYSVRAKNEIMAHIKDELLKESVVKEDSSDIICMKNGLVNTITGEWMHHDPKKVFFHHVNYPYDPTLDIKKSEFHKFLVPSMYPREVAGVSEEARFQEALKKVDTAYEMFGYTLMPGNSLQKFFTLYGESNTFKSVFAEVMSNFVNSEYTSDVKLSDFTNNNDKFATADFDGKFLNICSELDSQAIKSTAILKSITGEDTQRLQEKFGKAYTKKLRVKFVIPTNELPTLPDTHAQSFFKRLVLIPFQQEVPDDKIIPGLSKMLSTEDNLSAIFNEALVAIKRLIGNNKFTFDRTWQEKQSFWSDAKNTIGSFIDTNCVICTEGQIEKYREANNRYPGYPLPKFRKDYEDYCHNKSFNPEPSDKFYTKVLKQCNGMVSLKRDKKEKNAQTYRGLMKRSDYIAFFGDDDLEEDSPTTLMDYHDELPSVDVMMDELEELVKSGKVTMRSLAILDEKLVLYADHLKNEGILKEQENRVLAWTN